MSYQERAKNIFLKHGTGAGDLASVIMKSEDQVDLLAKQCVRNVEEIGELRAALVISEKKELATRAVIESWKQDEGADAARLDWLDNHVGLYDVAEYFGRDLLTHDQMCNLRLREGIDKAMEAANNE